MPTTVDIAGVGQVDFADGMSQEDVATAAGHLYRHADLSAQLEAERASQVKFQDRIQTPIDYAQAINNQLAFSTENPFGPIGPIAKPVGRAINFASDVAAAGVRDIRLNGINGGGFPTVSSVLGGSDPGPSPGGKVGAAVDAAGRVVPILAGAALLGPAVAPVVGPAAAEPAAFGLLNFSSAVDEGAPPVQALLAGATGAVTPGVMAASRQAGATLLGRAVAHGILSPGSNTAQKVVEAFAAQGGIQAFMEGMNLPEYAAMTPAEQKDALTSHLIQNTPFLLMDLPGILHKGQGSQTHANMMEDFATSQRPEVSRQFSDERVPAKTGNAKGTAAKVGHVMETILNDPAALDSLARSANDYAVQMTGRYMGGQAPDNSFVQPQDAPNPTGTRFPDYPGPTAAPANQPQGGESFQVGSEPGAVAPGAIRAEAAPALSLEDAHQRLAILQKLLAHGEAGGGLNPEIRARAEQKLRDLRGYIDHMEGGSPEAATAVDQPTEPPGPVVQVAPPAAPAEPPPAEVTLPTVRWPIVELPVANIHLSADVPNFKADADPKTGVVPGNELKGKYERLGTGPIVVWERNDGRLEVITGRHRLDLARRSGEETIPSQVVREKEGFSRAQALIFDAESNIRSGQGTVKDYANYFHSTRDQVTQADAMARGLLSRAAGRAGFDLGRHASDDTFAAFAGKAINEAQALAIARSAPGQPEAQQVGLKYALDGRSGDFISNIVKAALANSGGSAQALDLFGRDDSALKAAEAQAKKAAAVQRLIREQIAAVQGAAKRPEVARKLGVDVADPEGVAKRVEQLKADQARWENWPLHPDLVAQTRPAQPEAALREEMNRLPALTQADIEKLHKKAGVSEADYRSTVARALDPDPAANFVHSPGSFLIDPLSLTSTKQENSGSLNTAHYWMRKSADGLSPKRKPISVQLRQDGTIFVLDGNATTQAARIAGYDQVRVRIEEVEMPDGTIRPTLDAQFDVVGDHFVVRKHTLNFVNNTGEPIPVTAIEAALRSRMRQAMKINPGFGILLNRIAVEQPMVHAVLHAPVKSWAAARSKVLSDYAGDPRRIQDLVRGTLTTRTTADAINLVAWLKQRFGDDIVIKRQTFGRENDPAAGEAYKTGYTDALLYLNLGGHTVEIQVNQHNVAMAKDLKAHRQYEIIREIYRRATDQDRELTAEEKKQIDRAATRSKEIYEEARLEERAASTSLTNSSGDTGQPFRPADAPLNLRGGSTSNARQVSPPEGVGMVATGMPEFSNSANMVPAGNSRRSNGPLILRENSLLPLAPQGNSGMANQTRLNRELNSMVDAGRHRELTAVEKERVLELRRQLGQSEFTLGYEPTTTAEAIDRARANAQDAGEVQRLQAARLTAGTLEIGGDLFGPLDDQLSLFERRRRTVYDQAQSEFSFDGPAPARAAVGAVPGRSKPQSNLLANAISAELRHRGYVSFIGKRISNAEDLATLTQVLRDPRYETMRIFWTKGDTIVGQAAATSRLPGIVETAGSLEAIKEGLANFGADGFWLLHNHPSGNPGPSQADLQVTELIRRASSSWGFPVNPVFKGHVIIDSNQFGHIYPTPGNPGRFGMIGFDVLPHNYGPDRLLQPSVRHPVLGKKMDTPYAVAQLAKDFLRPGWVVLMGQGPSGIRGVTEVPQSMFGGKNEALKLAAFARRFAVQTGSAQVFVSGVAPTSENRAKAELAVRTGVVEDVAYTDGRTARMVVNAHQMFLAGKAVHSNKWIEGGPASLRKSAKAAMPTALPDGPPLPYDPHGPSSAEPARPAAENARPEDAHTQPVSAISALKPAENGGRKAIILPNGVALVGQVAHGLLWNKATDRGVATDEGLYNGKAGYVTPEGKAWSVDGHELPNVERVVVLNEKGVPYQAPLVGLTSVEERERKFSARFNADARMRPEVRDATGNRIYQVKPNEVTVTEAMQVVTKLGVDGAIVEMKDEGSSMPERVRVALGQAIIAKANHEFGATGSAAALQRAADTAEWLTSYGTRLGQGVQAFAMWSRMAPEGMVAAYVRAVEKSAAAARERGAIKVPEVDPKLKAEILRRAIAAQRKPAGFQRDEAVAGVLALIERAKGISKLDVGIGLWYANILSGWTTQVRNLAGNLGNLLAETAAQIAVRPLALPEMAIGLYQGAIRGTLDAAAIMRTGVQSGTRVGKVEVPRALELVKFTGAAYPLNAWKYVFRTMAAADMVFFRSAEEMRAHVLAREVVNMAGLPMGNAGKSRMLAALLHQSDPMRAAAEAQAAREGLTGATARRRVYEIAQQGRPADLVSATAEYGKFATFNQDPQGVLGTLARTISSASEEFAPLRLVVPFTRIVANVTNNSLNFTPWGYRRLFPSAFLKTDWMTGATPMDYQMQAARATLGTLGLVGLYALAATHQDEEDPQFMVTATGPQDPAARRQLMETGWQPYTVKVGDTYISYRESPLAMGLAYTGSILDAQRFKKLDQQDTMTRAAYALHQVGNALLSQSFMQGLSQFFSDLASDRVSAGAGAAEFKSLSRTTGTVLPNLLKLDRLFDPQLYDAGTISGALLRDVPIARSLVGLKPQINVLGEPVQAQINPFLRRAKTDDLWLTLGRRQLWISTPSKSMVVGDEVISAQDYYDYVEMSGQGIRRRLDAVQLRLDMVGHEEARKMVVAIESSERETARRRLFGRRTTTKPQD